MVHELIGIQDNKVDLRNIGKSSKDHKVVILFNVSWLSALSSPMHEKVLTSMQFSHSQEVVLSSEQDPFFKANMYENFGDIGMNIKKLVDDFQQIAKSNQNIQTIGSSSVMCLF